VNVSPSFNVFCGDIDATDVTGNTNTTVEIAAYIYNILVGPENESAQSYSLSLSTVSGGDPAAIVNSMNLANNGDISLNINIMNSGVATLQVSMVDSGGTQFGGIDTTAMLFNVHNYADLNLDPAYIDLALNDILYKNTFDPCRE
ncbi:MAG: hypothetical protein L3J52_07000, partial [Proteobacteria bacterium]|nr:hypothetical protein [Pseudomonadota bacterium]